MRGFELVAQLHELRDRSYSVVLAPGVNERDPT
jgi:hypothetical protein